MGCKSQKPEEEDLLSELCTKTRILDFEKRFFVTMFIYKSLTSESLLKFKFHV
jgi:hypothetical protein